MTHELGRDGASIDDVNGAGGNPERCTRRLWQREVTITGDVVVANPRGSDGSGATYVSLDGISFRAER